MSSLRDDLTQLVEEAPANPDRLRAVHRRATVLRRRRVAGAAAGVVAVVVAVAVALTSVLPRDAGQPTAPVTPPQRLPTGLLLVDPRGQLHRLDDLRSRQLSDLGGSRLQPQATLVPLADGRVVTEAADRDIVVLDPRHPDRLHTLVSVSSRSAIDIGYGGPVPLIRYAIPGHGDRLALPMAPLYDGERIWVATSPAGTVDPRYPTGGPEMVPLDLAGRLAGAVVRLPADGTPLAFGRGGFYVTVSARPGAPHGAVEWVGPGGAVTVVARAAASPPGRDQGGPGGVVWQDCTGRCDEVQLLDVGTGRVRTASVDVGPQRSLQAEVWFSPDGRYAAAVASAMPTLGDGPQWRGWGVLDLRTGRVTVVPGSVIADRTWSVQPPVWSGDRLIWQVSTRDGRSVVGGYLPASGEWAVTTVPGTDLRPLGAAG